MAEILPVHPVGWNGMKSHWWQFVSSSLRVACSFARTQNTNQIKVTIGILLACIIVGSVYIMWSLTLRIYKLYKVSSIPQIYYPRLPEGFIGT